MFPKWPPTWLHLIGRSTMMLSTGFSASCESYHFGETTAPPLGQSFHISCALPRSAEGLWRWVDLLVLHERYDYVAEEEVRVRQAVPLVHATAEVLGQQDCPKRCGQHPVQHSTHSCESPSHWWDALGDGKMSCVPHMLNRSSSKASQPR